MIENQNVLSNNKSKNVKLNLLKGFACIGVVFIHVVFPGKTGQILVYASQYAVPIFFMIAGYYAFKKGYEVILRRLIKIVKIFIFAYLLTLLYYMIVPALHHTLDDWLILNFNWKTPIKYLCFCTIDFAIHLWYLIAMIEIYIFWLLFVRKGKEKGTVKIFPILFILHILLTSYCETMNLDWFWKVNFITRGLSWFLLGYYLHTPKSKSIRDFSSVKLWILVVIGCLISIIPVAFNLKFKFNVIGYIPFALGLFVLTLKEPGRSICKPIEFIGENLSLFIYIFHPLVRDALNTVLAKVGLNIYNNVFLWVKPIIVLLITILLSYIFYLRKKLKNELLTSKVL